MINNDLDGGEDMSRMDWSEVRDLAKERKSFKCMSKLLDMDIEQQRYIAHHLGLDLQTLANKFWNLQISNNLWDGNANHDEYYFYLDFFGYGRVLDAIVIKMCHQVLDSLSRNDLSFPFYRKRFQKLIDAKKKAFYGKVPLSYVGFVRFNEFGLGNHLKFENVFPRHCWIFDALHMRDRLEMIRYAVREYREYFIFGDGCDDYKLDLYMNSIAVEKDIRIFLRLEFDKMFVEFPVG